MDLGILECLDISVVEETGRIFTHRDKDCEEDRKEER